MAQLERGCGADKHGHNGSLASHLLVAAVVCLEDLPVELDVVCDRVDVVEVLRGVLDRCDHLMNILCSLSCPVPCGNCEGVDCKVGECIYDLCGVGQILFVGVPGLVLVVTEVVAHLDSGSEVSVEHGSRVGHLDCVLVIPSVEVELLGGGHQSLVDQL